MQETKKGGRTGGPLPRMTFTAAGDMLVQRRLPPEYEGFREIRRIISSADARFVNLETTIIRNDGYAGQYGGGSWLKADPGVLRDIRRFGFNMLSFANNHAMVFSHWGLCETLKYLYEAGFVHAGCGYNLDHAAAPAYLETNKGRVALIAVTATLEEPSMAGRQSRRFAGRPGVNGLRHEEIYTVTKEYMDLIENLADATAINAYDDILRSEGYLPDLPKGCQKLGNLTFHLGEEMGRISRVRREDMDRVERAIEEAGFQADYILIAVHSHEVQGTEKETPDDFLIEFSHRCIDCGAHAVIGTGPHLLRPIEIYKRRPIFYSLGDFVLQNENISCAPEEFYESYGLNSDDTMYELFKTRSAGFTKGLQTDRRMFETVIPYWEMEEGELKILALIPVELGFGLPRSRNGLPRREMSDSNIGLPSREMSDRIIGRLEKMSERFGTRMLRTEESWAQVVIPSGE